MHINIERLILMLIFISSAIYPVYLFDRSVCPKYVVTRYNLTHVRTRHRSSEITYAHSK